MNVKLQGLLNAADWIEATYGTEELESILDACSPTVAERYRERIAINWHPKSEFVELLDQAERRLGTGDGKVAAEIGAAGARKNLSGSVARALFYVARPQFLMRRVAGLWSRFNDEGTMEVPLFDNDGHLQMEVKGVPDPHVLFCATITGWCREFATRFRAHHPVVEHVECRARGDARCLWDARWDGFEAR